MVKPSQMVGSSTSQSEFQLPLSPSAQVKGSPGVAEGATRTAAVRCSVGLLHWCCRVGDAQSSGVWLSMHDEAPLVEQEAQAVNSQLARKRLLSVHKVADEDKEHDEDIQVHGRREEEVVGQEEEGLGSVSALDGPDNSGCLDGGSAIGGNLEGNDLGEKGHLLG